MTQTPSFARLWRRRKQQGWRSRSALTCLALGGTLFVAAGAGLGGYLGLRNLLRDRARATILLQSQRRSEQLDAWLARRKQIVKMLARNPALQTEEAIAYLEQEVPQFPDFDGFGVAQPDGTFATTLALENRLPLVRQSAQQASTGRAIVSEPFWDSRLDIPLIAIASPIPSPSSQPPLGSLVGAIRAQEALDLLARPDSETLILNAQGVPIAIARNSRLEAADPKLKSRVQPLSNSPPALEIVTFQGRRTYIAVFPLQEADWSVAFVIPLQMVEKDLKILNISAAILSGVLLLGVYGALRLIIASEHLHIRAEREALLNRLTERIRASLNLDEILQATVKEVGTLLYLQRTAFAWFDPQTQMWEIEHGLVYPPLSPLNPEARSLPLTEVVLQRQARGYLAFPVRTQAGRRGYLICLQANRGKWTQPEKELLRAVTDQLAIAITQSHLYQQTQQQLKELQRTQSHLIQREKMSGLGRMVAGIAHEINNPINFIYANHLYVHQYATDLLKLLKLYQQNLPNAPSEIADFEAEIDWDFIAQDLPQILSSMKMGAERIHKIVLSLRNFSRLDESQRKTVDVREGIESTLLLLQSRLENRISVSKNYGNLPKIECYPGELNQVFMNLLANSIDAIQAADRAQGEIAIATQVLENTTPAIVCIRIQDNGIGIPKEIQGKIFDPFFTTKPVGQGVGLGLAASYQIVVDLHKGKIRVQTLPEGGTVFWVEIPIG